MMDWKSAVGDVAILSTVCLFLTGIPICRKLWKNRSTIGTSPLPFLTAFVSCSFWFFYGIMKEDVQIQVVNFFGLVLQIVYIGFYVHVCNAKSEIRKKLAITLLAPLALLAALWTLSADNESLTRNLGLLSSVASLVFFASPLANVALVIRTQNTSSMPLPLITLSCLQSILWFLYGILAKDTFVQIPNLLSSTITGLQLMLFLVFSDNKKEDVLLIEQGIN